MKGKITSILSVWGLLLLALVLVGLVAVAPAAVHADDLTVCKNAPADCQYGTIQAALNDAGPGDVIKVAQGTYSDINTQGEFRQVAWITKTLTLQGGYTTTNAFAGPPDPEAYPTTVDAQDSGRGMVISGTISPLVEGLRITGGNATGTGPGPDPTYNRGGGVLIIAATATISNCNVYGNVASDVEQSGLGGGLYLHLADATVTASLVQTNTANSSTDTGLGGGLYIYQSAATVASTEIKSNKAATGDFGRGGGIFLKEADDTTLTGNRIHDNTASTARWGGGGGVYMSGDNVTVKDNVLWDNCASDAADGSGGAFFLTFGDVTLTGNEVVENLASETDEGHGGGLYASEANYRVTLLNNLFEANIASEGDNGYGGGLYLDASVVTMDSNWIVGNIATDAEFQEGQGGGVFVKKCDPVTMTNNAVMDNHATSGGSNLWFEGEGGGALMAAGRLVQLEGVDTWPTRARLMHNTIVGQGPPVLKVDNEGSGLHAPLDDDDSGEGIRIGPLATVALTNTIFTTHQFVAVTATENGTVTLESTLWYGNAQWTGGDGSIQTSNDYTGDPAFAEVGENVDPHLTLASAALDQGIDAGVDHDFDGESRPRGQAPDLGADEAICLTDAILEGPGEGLVGVEYAFTATVLPPTATLPVSYTWDATGKDPASATGGVTDVTGYDWDSDGPKVVTVTASNGCGTVTRTHTINLCRPLASVSINGPLTGTVGMTGTFTASYTPANATAPIAFAWVPEPASGQGTASANVAWTTSGTLTITLTASNDCSEEMAVRAVKVSDDGLFRVYLPLVLRNYP